MLNLICHDELNWNQLLTFQGEVPDPEPGCNSECVENAKSLWASKSSSRTGFTIEMQNIVPFG